MRNYRCLLGMIASFLACGCAVSQATEGALDSSFGDGGKVQLDPSGGYTSPVANDVVVQNDGKVVLVGYEARSSDGFEEWRITRLNADGSPDTTFGPDHSGTVHYNSGSPGTRAYSVAMRPDGRIVVGGNYAPGVATSWAIVMQLTSSGDLDPTFGDADTNGYIILTPAAGDSTYLSRLLVDSDGTVDAAGTYYDNQGGFNGNQFFFDRVRVNGSSNEPFQYQFGSGPNQDDHGLGLAIDGQGRYVVGGYHRGASGNYDCAVIRIRRDLEDVDLTFGTGGQQTIAFDLGGDNGDFCSAVTVVSPGSYIALGGHATATAGGGTYQAAILALLDDTGHLAEHNCASACLYDKFAFAYDNNPQAGLDNTISKLILDDYDTRFPQLIAVGSGYHGGSPYGNGFGIARLDLPASANFAFDPAFNGGVPLAVDFDECPDGLGLLRTENEALSATFAGGKVLAVGYTSPCTGGSQIAATRLAAFDGIYKNGFETPYYP